MKNWFYLSFGDGTRPKGDRWVGASIVLAESEEGAIQEAWKFGVSAGGQVAVIKIDGRPHEGDSYRLITDKQEAQDLTFEEV